jgi:hypothetical protein
MTLIDTKLTTLDTYATQNLHYELEELNIVDWACQLIVTEMTWAVVVI